VKENPHFSHVIIGFDAKNTLRYITAVVARRRRCQTAALQRHREHRRRAPKPVIRDK
jgi:hypothetical protein